MKQVWMAETGGTEVLEIETVDPPSPGPSEVLVETRSVGINFAEIEKRKGVYPGEVWEPPRVPGMEAAGEIVDTGREVDAYEVGDRVIVLALREGGVYREQLCVDPTEVIVEPLPDGIPYDEGVALSITYLTAAGVLFQKADLSGEDTVLIHAAAGGVGTAAVQLAADAGATTLGTASTPGKLDFAQSNGLDYPINYTEADVAEAVAEYTDGAGVSVVLDAVGGDAFKESIEVLRPYGICVSYGVASGRPGLVTTSTLLHDNLDLKGFHLTTAIYDPRSSFDAAATFADLCDRYEEGAADPHIDARFPIEEVADAQHYVEDRSSRGKVVVHC